MNGVEVMVLMKVLILIYVYLVILLGLVDGLLLIIVMCMG